LAPATRPHHGDAATIEMLAARVGELEAALQGLIDECAGQDSRPPRPALMRAGGCPAPEEPVVIVPTALAAPAPEPSRWRTLAEPLMAVEVCGHRAMTGTRR
jgi:hypothetical protein